MSGKLQVESRHLRYFLAVAEEKHFTRAAARLQVSQPSLSQQIAQLEEHVGARLFERAGRFTTLSREGTLFLPYAQRALQEIENGCAALRDAMELKRGSLDFGVVQTLNSNLIPHFLNRFRKAFPQVDLLVRELSAPEIEVQVSSGRLDLGISILPTHLPHVQAAPLIEEEFIVVVGRTNPLFGTVLPVRLKQLAGYPLIGLADAFRSQGMLRNAFERGQLPFKPVAQLNSIEAVLRTVESTARSYSVLPAFALKPGSQQLQLLAIARPDRITRTVGFLWTGNGNQQRLVQSVAGPTSEILKETLAANF